MIWSEGSYGSQFQKRWRLSIRKNNGYLESKFCPNRRIFVFWRTFWIQNGRHSTPKWTPYGEVCLTTCKYPFPLKSLFIFSFLTIYFDFILAAILKFEKQRAQLWVMIYFCVKFRKDQLYGANLTFFAPWSPWQRPPFWIFSTPQKLPHTTVDIPTKFHEVWWKESKQI